MIHSFKTNCNANGNINVEFYEDNKRRQIIFTKGTDALITLKLRLMDTDQDAQQAIKLMKSTYLFKANANNPSIFRPIAKSLILA